MQNSIQSPFEQSSIPAMELPTRQSIADGLIAVRDPRWLKKEEKFALYLAIEAAAGGDTGINRVLDSIGISRQIYYGAIWFNDEQAAEIKAKIDTAKENADHQKGAVKTTVARARKRTATEILAILTEARRLRYSMNYDLEEACRRAGTNLHWFNEWNARIDSLRKRARRERGEVSPRQKIANSVMHFENTENFIQKDEVDVDEDDMEKKSSTPKKRGKQPRPSMIDADFASVEEREKIIHKIHELTISENMTTVQAAHSQRITVKTYNLWCKQIEMAGKASEEKTIDIWNRYKAASTEAERKKAVDEMIKRYTPMAARVAWKYASKSYNRLDQELLESVGLFEGVVQNLDVFDPERGTHIDTFFGQRIGLRIVDEARRNDLAPRAEVKNLKKAKNAESDFFQLTGRMPYNDDEFAAFVGSSEYVPRYFPSQITISQIDRNIGAHSRDEEIFGNIPDKNVEEQEMELTEKVKVILSRCAGEQEATIIRGHYLQSKTFKEIGQEMQLSESRISQMHSSIITRLRRTFEGSDLN